MMLLLTGSDRPAAIVEFKRLIARFRAEEPNGKLFRLDSDLTNAVVLEELVSAQDLFGGSILIAAVDFLSRAESAATVFRRLDDFIFSSNRFIFLESEISTEAKEKLVKAGVQLKEFTAKVGLTTNSNFNIFRLTDALGERNRQKMWLLFSEALFRGLTAEEIFWKLVWLTKILLLIRNSPTPPPEIKPFVLFKAKRF